ncbi:putative aminopeptidase, partial [mine drainage metagenome]
TLGWLPDPIMSTMLRYGTDELVAMIFHELAHELLYVPNDSPFDEAFAMTVENTGLQRWLAYRHEPGRFAEFERLDAADMRFARLLRHTRERLARLYAAAIPARGCCGRSNRSSRGWHGASYGWSANSRSAPRFTTDGSARG